MTYKEQLLDPRWQRRRLEILERDDFRCDLCCDPFTTLHIHHRNYRNILAWEYQDHELITYCKHCHSIAEYYKKLDPNIILAKVIKRDMDGNTIYLYLIAIDSNASTIIDVFEYENDKLRYLLTMDKFTIYILGQTLGSDRFKETVNG